ncbi:MAG: oligosaccharide flippase family protein [Methyloprofundus sp.]|nr:oligosaccharide flippase family protein [Methyloprofundus sp.]
MNLLNPIKKLLPQNAFARGVSVLVGGTAGAQALMVLAAPLLTRLYTPEDFGLLAVYSGLLALFTVVASLRYELAIPLPESNTEAANLVVLSLLVVLLMTFISALMVVLAGEKIAHALDTPKLANYFWLLPLGVFLSGVYKVFNYWAVRTKHFGDIARTRISQTLATLAVQLLGYKLGGIALLFGQAGGQGVGSLRLARSAIKHKEFSNWSWTGVGAAARRYKQFPIFSTWTGLFNTASSQLPPILLASLFSSGAAGLFALANRVLAMPMSVLGGAVGNVFFSNAASAYRQGQLSSLVLSVHDKMAKVAMPITLTLVFFAPLLFSFVFGEDWRKAGEMVQWMAPWLYFQFVSSPLSSVFAVLNSENKTMLFQGILFASRLASMVYGGMYLDLIYTVALFSIVSLIFYIFYLSWIFRYSGLRVIDVFYVNLKLLSLLFPFILFCYFLYELAGYYNAFFYFFAALVFCVLFYYFLLFRRYFGED